MALKGGQVKRKMQGAAWVWGEKVVLADGLFDTIVRTRPEVLTFQNKTWFLTSKGGFLVDM